MRPSLLEHFLTITYVLKHPPNEGCSVQKKELPTNWDHSGELQSAPKSETEHSPLGGKSGQELTDIFHNIEKDMMPSMIIIRKSVLEVEQLI